MKDKAAKQTRKQSLTGKSVAGNEQKSMQPERKISRARMESDSQQGQSEADRLQAADQSSKKSK